VIEGPSLLVERVLLLAEHPSVAECLVLLAQCLLLLAECLCLFGQRLLSFAEGPLLFGQRLLLLLDGVLSVGESARQGIQFSQAVIESFGSSLEIALLLGIAGPVGLRPLLQLGDLLSGGPKLSEQAPGPCAAEAVGGGRSGTGLFAFGQLGRPRRGRGPGDGRNRRNRRSKVGHPIGVEHLELDGADAEAVARNQLRVAEGAAIESRVDGKTADHGARRSPKHQAVHRLDAASAEPERAAGPGADRTLRGSKPHDLPITRGAADPQNEFLVRDVQNRGSGNANHASSTQARTSRQGYPASTFPRDSRTPPPALNLLEDLAYGLWRVKGGPSRRGGPVGLGKTAAYLCRFCRLSDSDFGHTATATLYPGNLPGLEAPGGP